MRVEDLILSQFEIGKRYEITDYDEDNGFTKYKGTVEVIDSTTVFVSVYESDGKAHEEDATWFHWRDID